MREKINFRRLVPLLAIVFLALLTSAYLCNLGGFYIDEWLCVLFVDIIFLMLFIYELEYERIHKTLSNNTRTSFSKVLLGFFISCVMVLVFTYAPIYFKPFIMIPIIMGAVANDVNGLIVGMYFNIIFGMTLGGDYNELLSYCLLIVIGAVLSKSLYNKKFRIFGCIIIFCVSVTVPCIMYYWTNKEMVTNQYIYGAIDGWASVFVALFSAVLVRPSAEKEIDNLFLDIISDDYSMVKELKEYSLQEYEHAKKVSDIAYRCAHLTGLNESLCRAAGFYYRIGKWQGEPHVEKGIERAESLCFPESLINILAEYYGEEKNLSTPESALVQIIDAIIIKLEFLRGDVGSSQWNDEIIVYQILNEYSSKGLYDESGLSMNQFLKIREYLVKEESL